MMLRAVAIAPNPDSLHTLISPLSQRNEFRLVCVADKYPSTIEQLIRMLEMHTPDMVFLSVRELDSAVLIAKTVEEASGAQVVAIHESRDANALIAMMRAGVREILTIPIAEDELTTALNRVRELLILRPPKVAPTGNLYCFLPSKPGSGATTIAVNVSLSLARIPGQSVLFCDFDVQFGMASFLLRLGSESSIRSAMEYAYRMDEDLWRNLVVPAGGMDVLPAGDLSHGHMLEANAVGEVMGYARRTYSAVCVDLPGSLDPAALAVMSLAKQLFVVCTQEIPSLHLARLKVNALHEAGFKDRVGILVNRVDRKHALSTDEMESLLGARVKFSFPNDYPGVTASVEQGGYVEPSSELGKQFDLVARSISGLPMEVPAGHRRKFLQFFSVSPPKVLVSKRGGRA